MARLAFVDEEDRTYLEKLARALDHAVGESRLRAAYLLGFQGDSRAIPLLAKAVHTGALAVRLAYVVALGGLLPDADSVRCLQEASQDPNAVVRDLAVALLSVHATGPSRDGVGKACGG